MMQQDPKSDDEDKISEYRKEIPVLKDWIYLRHYNKGPLTLRTYNYLNQYLLDEMSSVKDRRRYWYDLSELARNHLATMVGGNSSNFAFTQNASEALSLIIDNYSWKPGLEIVTSFDEYPPYIRALKNLESTGVIVKIVESRNDILDLISKKTQLVLTSYVSWKNGVRYDLHQLLSACKEYNCEIILDSVQSTGCFDARNEFTNVDFLIGNSRKWLLGSIGLGFLYINSKNLSKFCRKCNRNALVTQEDGFLNWQTNYLTNNAVSLEPGGRNVFARLALYGSLEFLFEAGIGFIEKRILLLMEYATSLVLNLGLDVISSHSRQNMSGILAIKLTSEEQCKHILNYFYNNKIIATSYSNVLIIALHFFNTKIEIENVVDTLERALKVLK